MADEAKSLVVYQEPCAAIHSCRPLRPPPDAAMIQLNTSYAIQFAGALLVSAMPGAATVAEESVISEVDRLAKEEGQFSGHHGATRLSTHT